MLPFLDPTPCCMTLNISHGCCCLIVCHPQAGAHEVLGAQYGGGTISADGTRKLKPSLINCRRENAFKAQQYGRWIVLNRENPSETLGDQVPSYSPLCYRCASLQQSLQQLKIFSLEIAMLYLIIHYVTFDICVVSGVAS